MKDFDKLMLSALSDRLREQSHSHISLQAILTKVDTLPKDKASASIASMRREIAELAPSCLSPLLTIVSNQHHIGVDAVRESIVEACTSTRSK